VEAAELDGRLFNLRGEMGALMRAIDWSTTCPVETWPQSLRT